MWIKMYTNSYHKQLHLLPIFYCSLFDFYSFKTIANKFVVKVDYFSASCRHIDYECTFLFIAISTAKIVLMTIFINMQYMKTNSYCKFYIKTRYIATFYVNRQSHNYSFSFCCLNIFKSSFLPTAFDHISSSEKSIFKKIFSEQLVYTLQTPMFCYGEMILQVLQKMKIYFSTYKYSYF